MIPQMMLSMDDLVALGACPSARRWFAERYPAGETPLDKAFFRTLETTLPRHMYASWGVWLAFQLFSSSRPFLAPSDERVWLARPPLEAQRYRRAKALLLRLSDA